MIDVDTPPTAIIALTGSGVVTKGHQKLTISLEPSSKDRKSTRIDALWLTCSRNVIKVTVNRCDESEEHTSYVVSWQALLALNQLNRPTGNFLEFMGLPVMHDAKSVIFEFALPTVQSVHEEIGQILPPPLKDLIVGYAPPEQEVWAKVFVRRSWGGRVDAPLLAYHVQEAHRSITDANVTLELSEAWHVYKLVFYVRNVSHYLDCVESGELVVGKKSLLGFDRDTALTIDKLMHDACTPDQPIYTLTFDPEPQHRSAVMHLKGAKLTLRLKFWEAGSILSVLLLCLV